MYWPASGAAYRFTMPISPAAEVRSWYSGSSARVPLSVRSDTAWAVSWSSAMIAQSPSKTHPPVVAGVSPLPQSRTLASPASALSASLTCTTKTGAGVSPAGIHRGNGHPVAEPGLDVLGVVESAVGALLELLEEPLADVVVGVEAELVLERRELVEGLERLDLLHATGVEVDRGVADGGARQRFVGLGTGGEERHGRPGSDAHHGESRHGGADQEGPLAAAAGRHGLRRWVDGGPATRLEVLGLGRLGRLDGRDREGV